MNKACKVDYFYAWDKHNNNNGNALSLPQIIIDNAYCHICGNSCQAKHHVLQDGKKHCKRCYNDDSIADLFSDK